MIKVLRSLLHEMLPLDLRIQIELLSRRRDISNKEKQEELLLLLRKFNIENIVQLGPGTNRYAFKLKGFVIKVATDHDGKIDNFKEFKMAKVLFPNVTKIYEISENGTLLVAEYVQPFGSFAEMLMYADQIRDILKELSSMYLIGDVGVSSVNYTNWGLRIGTNQPVCLDFAYVYEVSSELFVCRKTGCHGILVPDKDFNSLHCSNPACQQQYSFSDIRARIGNDEHNHEIGDLTQEGYLLSESNVPIELDEYKSSYLVKHKLDKSKTKSEKDEEVEETEDFQFVMPYNPKIYSHLKQEGKIMGKYLKDLDVIAANISANEKRYRVVSNYVSKGGTTITDIPIEIVDSNSSKINNSITVEIINEEVPTPVDIAPVPEVQNKPEVAIIDNDTSEPKVEEETEDTAESVAMSHDIDINAISTKGVYEYPNIKPKAEKVQDPPIVHEIKPKTSSSLFSDDFRKECYFTFSDTAKKMKEYLMTFGVYEDVKQSLKGASKNLFEGDFYNNISKAIFNSLQDFCNFTIEVNNDENGNFAGRKYIPPIEMDNQVYTPTLIFMKNMRELHKKKRILFMDADKVMPTYRKDYPEFDGLQPEIIPILRKKLRIKINTDDSTISSIINILKDEWFATNIPEITPINDEPDDPTDNPPADEATISNDDGVEAPMVEETDTPEVITEESEYIPEDESEEDNEDTEEDSDDSEYYSYDDPDYDGNVTVTLYRYVGGTNTDIIKLEALDESGEISIPIYVNIDEINPDSIQTQIDDMNGDWDWLTLIKPAIMFLSSDPEPYFITDEEVPDMYVGNFLRAAILGIDEETNKYIMGCFSFTNMFVVEDGILRTLFNGPNTTTYDKLLIKKIRAALISNLFDTSLNHLDLTLQLRDDIYNEEYIKALSTIDKATDDEDDETIESSNEELDEAMNELQDAALNAIMGDQSSEEEVYNPDEDEDNDSSDEPQEVISDISSMIDVEDSDGRPRKKNKRNRDNYRDSEPEPEERMVFKPMRRGDRRR